MVFCSNTLKVQPSACSTAQCSWAAPGRTIGCSMHEPHSLLLAMLQISLLNPCSALQHMNILPFAGLCPCSSPFSVHLVLPNYPERGIGKNAWVEKEMFITLKCDHSCQNMYILKWINIYIYIVYFIYKANWETLREGVKEQLISVWCTTWVQRADSFMHIKSFR